MEDLYYRVSFLCREQIEVLLVVPDEVLSHVRSSLKDVLWRPLFYHT